MTPSLRWKLVAGGAAIAAAAAAGVAVASAGHRDLTPPPPVLSPRPERPFGGLDAAATYLGLTQQQLFERLRSGQTLAQVAGATSGKSVDGLVAALVAAQKQQLDAAVSSGRLTRAQADAFEAQLQERVTAMVNGTLGPGRRGPRPHGPTF